MNRILVIEDEPDIQEVLRNYLQASGYAVLVAGDGEEGLTVFQKEAVDLVLLDVMLPKVDGFTVLERIRKISGTPVILVTARDSVEDQVKGFGLLADDYIPKPFDMPVLLCKVAAVLRRTGKCETETDKMICCGNLRLDAERYRAYCGDTELELTTKEFELLRVFMENPGRVFTRQRLLDLVWGMDYFGDERIVDTHIKNLRKKLDRDVIRTVRGVGYRLEKKGEEKA